MRGWIPSWSSENLLFVDPIFGPHWPSTSFFSKKNSILFYWKKENVAKNVCSHFIASGWNEMVDKTSLFFYREKLVFCRILQLLSVMLMKAGIEHHPPAIVDVFFGRIWRINEWRAAATNAIYSSVCSRGFQGSISSLLANGTPPDYSNT